MSRMAVAKAQWERHIEQELGGDDGRPKRVSLVTQMIRIAIAAAFKVIAATLPFGSVYEAELTAKGGRLI